MKANEKGATPFPHAGVPWAAIRRSEAARHNRAITHAMGFFIGGSLRVVIQEPTQ